MAYKNIYTRPNVRVAVEGKAGIIVSRSGGEFLLYSTVGENTREGWVRLFNRACAKFGGKGV